MKNWRPLFFRISPFVLFALFLFSSCKEDEPSEDPAGLVEITTMEVQDISSFDAISGGNISGDGGAAITVRGLVWGTAENPTTAENEGISSEGEGTEAFTSTMTNLLPYTTYFVRAYATNSAGTAYGNQVEFETLPEGAYGSVTDIDGNIYWTIAVGEIEWMVQNLRTTKYSDGTPIPAGLSPEEWETTTEGAYFNPYEDSAFIKFIEPALEIDDYGFLYNAWAMRSTFKKPCPEGWFIPTEGDWENMESGLKLLYNVDDYELARIMKSCRQVNSPLGGGCNTIYHPRWDEHPNIYGSNQAFFLALPSGFLESTMEYKFHGTGVWWWLFTHEGDISSTNPRRNLLHNSDLVWGGVKNSNAGLSIRCCRPLVKE